MEKALLISESSVYKTEKGGLVSRGGGEVYIHNLAKLLKKVGVEATVFAIQEFDGQAKEEVIEGILYKRCAVHSRKSFSLFRYLRAALKESKDYDFVFLNQFIPHLILPWIKKAKKIAIIFDLYVYEGFLFWIRQYGLFVGGIGWLVEKFQLIFDRKYADMVMTISECSKNKALAVLGKKFVDKVVIVPAVVCQKDKFDYLKKENMILFVGRFVEYKHPEHVLFVLKKLLEIWPDIKAKFIVARTMEVSLKIFKKWKNKLNIDDKNIDILTGLNNEEVEDLTGKAKLLVHPSLIEGQGIVVLEALNAGRPVVAYNLPAYRGMLISGKNSLLVENGDFESLADAAIKVIKDYEKYQKNCQISLKDFSEERWLDVLKKVVE
jgi:glycosyltransferase involved in cell wall biosynthesis